ncbi:MAG: histone deacetylase [Deltaproteobacteria bacterium]|nr:histone deacetylase [Deltaproteobacteria bacterium]MDQ3295848.1 histone deacetylase [Myxococcota bacterium]
MRTLPVFYTPRMVASSNSMSPSAAKPSAVVASWRALQLPLEIIEPAPVTLDELAAVHDRAYVEAILACREPNGFGNCSPEVAASLVYTSGSMLAAAQHAVAHGGIACAPCSGFHHAGYRAGGFCTFNGLVVAACALRAGGHARRVGILDCDMHYGDGTDELIEAGDLGDWIVHFTAGAEYQHPHQADAFLARLPAIARSMHDCDVVLYQAGADPHVDDPLGGWLTTAELRRRDEIVFETFAALDVPVAWNFAGGYQVERDGSIPKVLEIHENTARAALAVLGSRPAMAR